MNAARAKRRWLRWSRYVASTDTLNGDVGRRWSYGFHHGHAKAYEACMFAGRGVPRGARSVWYARWMIRG